MSTLPLLWKLLTSLLFASTGRVQSLLTVVRLETSSFKLDVVAISPKILAIFALKAAKSVLSSLLMEGHEYVRLEMLMREERYVSSNKRR